MKRIFVLLIGIMLLTSCTKETPVVTLEKGRDNIEVHTENYEVAACLLQVEDQSYIMEMDDSNLDINTVGNCQIHYTYLYDEVLYDCTRVIFVNDTTPPIITLNASIDTISLNEEWIDEGVSYSDNYSDSLTLKTIGSVDTTKPGTYEINYEVTDEFGNSSSITRIVTVY